MATQPANKPVRKGPRWRRRLAWLAAAFLVYTLIGFLGLPPIIRSQLTKQLTSATKRQTTVRQVKFNPLALSLTVRGLSLAEPDGQVFASWEELYVNFQLSSAFRLAWTFAEIGLKQPYGHVVLFKHGHFNFSDMQEPTPAPSKPKASGGIPRINVGWLHIDDGAFAMDDETHRLPLHTEFKPISISLTNLTTRAGKDSVYSFEARSDSGRSLSWTGTLMVEPFQSRGHFELNNGVLPKWTPLLRDYLRAEIAEGRFNIRADYALAAGTNGFDARVTNGVVALSGLKVKDLNSGELVTTLPWLALQGIEFNLLRHSLRVAKARMTGWSKIVRVEKDGSLNLNLLVEPRPEAKPTVTNSVPAAPATPWTVTVDDFLLKEAAVAFADLSRSRRFDTTLKPIQFHVRGFTTAPDSDAAYDFSIATEAAETLKGKGTFALTPLRSTGEINLAGVEIKKYAPYFENLLRGEVLSGKVGAGLQYQFAAGTNGPSLTISNAGVALADFQLKAADTGETVVGIPAFAVEGTEASLAERSVQVGLVKSTGGSILARQTKDGKVNLLGLFHAPPATPAPTNPPAIASQPWSVLLKEIAFEDYAIKLEDQKPAKPASLGVDQLAINVKGLCLASNAPIAVSMSTRLNQAGTVAVSGTAKIAPPSAELEVGVTDLDLRPFQPYLNEAVRLTLGSGRLNTHGHVRYTPPGAGAPLVTFAGDLGLTNFVTIDQVLFKEFVRWDALNVAGIALELEPNRLQVQEVRWAGLQTSVAIGPDHRPNVQTILPEKAPTPAPTPPPAPAPPAAAFPLQLDALVLENAAFHFADESIEPHATFDIQQFGGTVKGLSSQDQSTAVIDVKGKVDAVSPFSIAGKVNPLARDLRLELAVGFTNTDLTAFTTYLEKYAGYPLNRGKLSLTLRYDIREKQLKAENKVLVDHFTLGARNDSTNATKLPVKLAVALLKDRKGQINLDIPVSGRTDDPQFKVAPIIFKVVLNLIVKAATSPFSLLGALVGGGEELSYVDFKPGQADIPDTEAQKLDKLAKALYERPAVNLEVAGSFDSEQDRPALARQKLEQHLKTLRLMELSQAGQAAAGPEGLQLEPPDRERLLRQLFAGLGTNQTLELKTGSLALSTNLAGLPKAIALTNAGAKASVSNAVAQVPRRQASALEAKGATALVVAKAKPTPAPKPSAPPPPPAVSEDDAALTLEQVEARLVAAIKVTETDQRDLIKQRAQAVQSYILRDGKLAAERLFIVTPKATSAKGQSRVNLSLN